MGLAKLAMWIAVIVVGIPALGIVAVTGHELGHCGMAWARGNREPCTITIDPPSRDWFKDGWARATPGTNNDHHVLSPATGGWLIIGAIGLIAASFLSLDD